MKRKVLAIMAVVCGLVGLGLFFLFDLIAYEVEGQSTVSELLWEFLDWGPASYVLVGGIMVGIFGWAFMHILGKGRWG